MASPTAVSSPIEVLSPEEVLSPMQELSPLQESSPTEKSTATEASKFGTGDLDDLTRAQDPTVTVLVAEMKRAVIYTGFYAGMSFGLYPEGIEMPRNPVGARPTALDMWDYADELNAKLNGMEISVTNAASKTGDGQVADEAKQTAAELERAQLQEVKALLRREQQLAKPTALNNGVSAGKISKRQGKKLAKAARKASQQTSPRDAMGLTAESLMDVNTMAINAIDLATGNSMDVSMDPTTENPMNINTMPANAMPAAMAEDLQVLDSKTVDNSSPAERQKLHADIQHGSL